MDINEPRICVAGIGAIGGLLAGLLGQRYRRLSVVARGATLDTIRNQGLCLDMEGTPHVVHPAHADVTAPDEIQDIIILCGKSYHLPGLARAVAGAVGPDTVIIPVVNGIPWWFATPGMPDAAKALAHLLDPAGTLGATFARRNIMGCVAYAFAAQAATGKIVSHKKPLLMLGDITPDPAGDLKQVTTILQAAGIGVQACPDIRAALWTKLAANLATNPVSVLCPATLAQLGHDAHSASVIEAIVHETLAIGRAYGVTADMSAVDIMALIRKGPAHRTSMLQDFLAGRMLELDAIGIAPLLLASHANLPAPVIHAIVNLTRFRASTMQADGPG
ncbi:ketopantoate reductase family protein [Komagataeibacter xylinus]|uniref:2-dehydropantoate 2-reductase n=1 Tax=Komagataeibacter xylinus TaxID=28448 RepID=A0A857FS74_KOMXY|nr:2-dehydropantoate 2-reductase [Komagataeibacter xylinus]QHC35997.1 2-dehydropantoate 2-reductase [Komagataeibacter xylinus]